VMHTAADSLPDTTTTSSLRVIVSLAGRLRIAAHRLDSGARHGACTGRLQFLHYKDVISERPM